MATSYLTLIADKSTGGSIKNWTNISRVDPATCVGMAEDIIFSGYVAAGGQRFSALRIMQMRKQFTFTTAIADTSAVLPARFLDPIELYDRTNDKYVGQVYESAMLGHRSYTAGAIDEGTPNYYAIFGDADGDNEDDQLIQFDAACDEAIAYTLLYYGRPAPLSAENPTNWLTNKYGTLLLKACLAAAYEFDDDTPNFQKAMGQVMTGIAAINAESDLTRRGMLTDRETP